MQLSVVRCLLRLRAPLLPGLVSTGGRGGPGGPRPMSFTFCSPTEVFFNGASVKQVDVLNHDRVLWYPPLPAHVPTLQVLAPGVVTVFSDEGVASKYFVSSGSVTVNPDSSVQLLAEEAYPLDMLNINPAKANLEKAQTELSSASDKVAKAEAQINLEATQAIVKALE